MRESAYENISVRDVCKRICILCVCVLTVIAYNTADCRAAEYVFSNIDFLSSQ